MTQPRIVVIDNYDSFVHNLARYLRRLGARTEVVRNDEVTADAVLAEQPDGILLSPGPCTPREAGICVELVQKAAMTAPLLGICLGHQAIAEAYGGRVLRARTPVHGKASLMEHDGRGIFQDIPSPVRVGRYHSLVVKLKPRGPLVPTAVTYDEHGNPVIMGLAHQRRPQVGLQFHPESILTEHGDAYLRNFLELAANWKAARDALGEAAQ